MLQQHGLDDVIVDRLGLDCPAADLSEWQRVVELEKTPEREVSIAMVGKYMDLLDAYKSLIEAIKRGYTRTKVKITYIDSGEIETREHLLHGMDAILVPGGFGERGVEGKNPVQSLCP